MYLYFYNFSLTRAVQPFLQQNIEISTLTKEQYHKKSQSSKQLKKNKDYELRFYKPS